MNTYAKIEPTFWIGETGRNLRQAGPEAQVVALYLLTNPHTNPLGLYYCPVMFIAHETGLGMEGASKGLRGAIEGGFCTYDKATEMAWVYEMARYQIADSLKEGDKRTTWIQKEYYGLPENPFLKPFFDKYQQAFHMQSMRSSSKPHGSPFEAPSKPITTATTTTTPIPTTTATAEKHSSDERFADFWSAYPKKVGKAKSLTVWKRKKLDGIADQIIDHVRQRARDDKTWLNGFVLHPERFLRDERWKDEIATELTHREKVLRALDDRDKPILEGRYANG
jgi:hypothetical protein